MEDLEQQILVRIQKLYPALSEMEARQGGRNMRRYFEIVDEIQRESTGLANDGIDKLQTGSTMKERSNKLKT